MVLAASASWGDAMAVVVMMAVMAVMVLMAVATVLMAVTMGMIAATMMDRSRMMGYRQGLAADVERR